MTVKTKPIPGPRQQLCWRPSERITEGRCDRQKDHNGPCSWELWRRMKAAETALRNVITERNEVQARLAELEGRRDVLV